jgi:hypothetical protein
VRSISADPYTEGSHRRAGRSASDPGRTTRPARTIVGVTLFDDDVNCPRCGSGMVVRHNRATGEDFWGCSRFPSCRGTRLIGAAAPKATSARSPRAPRPTKYRLSLGGRPKGLGDSSELVVARMIGRNLSKREGCLVQGLAVLLFFAVVYWFFTSGLFLTVVTAFSEWYAHQIRLPGAATPTPAG